MALRLDVELGTFRHRQRKSVVLAVRILSNQSQRSFEVYPAVLVPVHQITKRARDKGRGTLETDIEKAGGRTGARAPRKKKQKTEQGNTSEKDTAREETNKERGTKRKLNSEINPTKNPKN